MKNDIELLTIFLQKYGSKHIMQNKSHTIFANIYLCEETQSSFLPDNLYIVDCLGLHSFRFLQHTTNFLLVSVTNNEYLKYLSPDTNLILLEESPDLYQLYNSVLKCFHAFQTFRAHSYKLFHSIIGNENFHDFCNTVTDIISSPIAILDISNHVIAASAQKTSDESWNNLIEKNQLSSDGYWNGDTFFFTNTPSICPTIFPCPPGPAWINVGLFSHQECYYYLSGIECNNHFDDEAIGFFLCIADILENVIYQNNTTLQKKEYLTTFFQSIIHSVVLDKEDILNRSNKLNLKLKNTNYMIMLFHEKKSASYEEIVRLSELLKRSTNQIVFTYEFKIILILSDTQKNFHPSSLIHSLIEKKYLENWKACISYPFLSACDFKTAYEQCLAAEKWGKRSQKSQRIYDYKDYVLPHFLSDASAYVEIGKYCIPIANQILQYDKENDTEYAWTFYLYIKHFKDTKTVASIMNVHRNTIIYRIDRIVKLFDIDLNDSDLLQCIKLSYDILNYPVHL